MRKFTYLLHKFQDLFPLKFLEIKGIVGGLGEIKIPLKPDANLVNQRPYRFNLRYKEKVKEELDKILDAWIIGPMEE